jgi:hypothetical protein
LKEESQDRNLWSTQFVRGYGPIARQTTIWTWIKTEERQWTDVVVRMECLPHTTEACFHVKYRNREWWLL